MSKNEHKNEDELKKINLERTGNGYKLSIDYSGVGARLDIAQAALDAQVWQDVQMYMPHDTGNLKGATNALNATVTGKVYLYPPDSDYGHYQYEGEKYIDPKYHCGGFLTKDGWRSRKDVKKIPSGQPLKYTDPSAHAHWGEYAYEQHKNEWLETVKRALGL